MNRNDRVVAASLIRYGVKYMDVHGWNHYGASGLTGQVCPVMAICKAAQENTMPVTGASVQSAISALDDAAAALAPSEWSRDNNLSYIARYNEHPDRTATEVKNFMGHVANQLVNTTGKRK